MSITRSNTVEFAGGTLVPDLIEDILIGADVHLSDGTDFYLGRQIDVTDKVVENFFNKIKAATKVQIHPDGGLDVDGARHTTLGPAVKKTKTQVPYVIDGPITPHLEHHKPADAGTSDKEAWRYNVLINAQKIWGDRIPLGHQVVFLHGADTTEREKVWEAMGVPWPNMIIVEGDSEKCSQLAAKFSSVPVSERPRFVNGYLGKKSDKFSRALVSKLIPKPVAVLSLDTETLLSPALYTDVLESIRQIEIGSDLLFILNVATKRGSKAPQNIEALENLWKDKKGQPYNGKRGIKTDFLFQIPLFLQADLAPLDLSIAQSQMYQYKGIGGEVMQCVITHFQRK